MLKHVEYYKRNGIKRPSQLIDPVSMVLSELPRSSIYHYLTSNSTEKNLKSDVSWLSSNKKKVYIDFIDTLVEGTSKSIRRSISIKLLVKQYLIENRSFKYLKEPYKTVTNPMSILIANYNYIDDLYKYISLPMTSYNKWKDRQLTLWDYIARATEESERTHIVPISVPDDLTPYNILNIYLDKTNPSMLKVFNTDEDLTVLELWKWLHLKHRETSVLHAVNKEQYSKIDLLFTNSEGRHVLLNLGYLNSWIAGEANLTSFKTVTTFNDKQLSKMFYKFLSNMQSNIVEEGEPDLEVIKQLGPNSLKDEPEADAGDQIASPEQLDKDIEYLDVVSNTKLRSKGIIVDKKHGVKIVNSQEANLTAKEYKEIALVKKSPKDVLTNSVIKLAKDGVIKPAEVKVIEKDLAALSEMKNPYGGGATLIESSNISPVDLQLDDNLTTMEDSSLIKDKSMLKSSLMSFDKSYIDKVLKKDVLKSVLDLQKAGIVIKDYQIEETRTAVSEYETHTVKIKPINGKASIIKFRLPIVKDDGSFKVNNNTSKMRKQRVDLPIRKVASNIVALTSYYGKTFITRSALKVNDSSAWMFKHIQLEGLEPDNYIHGLAPANVFDNNFRSPYIYGLMASKYKSLKAGDVNLVFDYKERLKLVSEEVLAELETDGSLVAGIDGNNNPIVVDKNNEFYVSNKGTLTSLGDIWNILKLDVTKAPMDVVTLRVFSKAIPVGIVLSYYLGFTGMLKTIGADYEVVEGNRYKTNSSEYAVRFADKIYVFKRADKINSLIIAGLNVYSKQTKLYEASEFESKGVYLNLLITKKIGTIYLRELESLNTLFIDHITSSILESMGEPTTFMGLLIRSTEMLMSYNHPDSQDHTQMRIRGYERLAGAVYSEISTAIRSYNNRNVAGKSKIDIGHYDIWNKIIKDQSVKLTQSINPIESIKEGESATYLGVGGRTQETMNKASRAYHISDIGVVSEATVDSSAVGVNMNLSANPNFSNLRGVINKDKDINNTSLFNTTTLLMPGSNHDDFKRANFANIQSSHVIAADGYRQPHIRTGYEAIVANRTSSEFASVAKQDGKVVSINDVGIIVEYKDGSKEGVQLGTLYGKAEGSVYPHEVTTDLKEGKKFTKGDIIAYNTSFFEKDLLNPNSVVYKTYSVVKTALYESNETLEDSSAISAHTGKLMATKTTKIKNITLSFEQNIHNVVKINSNIKAGDPYLLIEDEITGGGEGFSDESLEILKRIGSQSPESKYNGIIRKIEVYYNGSKADMSDGIKKLADGSDRQLSLIRKSSGKEPVNGSVDSDYRVEGKSLEPDTAVVIIYMEVSDTAGVGDKVVFGNQLKSVIGKVMDYSMHTESGEAIDAVFGFKSISARIVNSPILMGTTTTLLKIIGNKATQIYKG